MGLGVESVHGADARAVKNLNVRWVLPGLLRLIVCCQESVAQSASHAGQLAILWQQQGDLGQRLAGELFQLDQRLRQLLRGRVLWVGGNPGINSALLLLQGASALGCAGQLQPAVEVSIAAGLQFALWQAGYQCPDGFLVVCGAGATEQWGDIGALARCCQGLPGGLQGVRAYQLAAYLLFNR